MTPSEPGERGQQRPDQEGRRVRHGDLLLELEKDGGEVAKTGQRGAQERPCPAHGLCPLEELLHAKRRPHLDSRLRHSGTGVAEPVGLPGWHGDRLTGLREHRATADPKTHPARHHSEPLFLAGMNVTGRHVRASGQVEVEGEQPAGSLRPALPNDDPFPTDRVLDDTRLDDAGAGLLSPRRR